MMKKYLFLSMAAFLVIISFAQTSQADWPIFSRPEFRGRIIDAETKQPIEGAVAVVYYSADMLIGGPGGPNSYVFHAKECLTDKKGEFYFPSYSSFHIISKGIGARFIFYKPGYMASYGPMYVNPFIMEDYFSADEAGKVGEIHVKQGTPASYKGLLGIVELKQAKTREEKLRTMPSPPADYTSKELPIFIKLINEEGRNLGLKGEYK